MFAPLASFSRSRLRSLIVESVISSRSHEVSLSLSLRSAMLRPAILPERAFDDSTSDSEMTIFLYEARYRDFCDFDLSDLTLS